MGWERREGRRGEDRRNGKGGAECPLLRILDMPLLLTYIPNKVVFVVETSEGTTSTQGGFLILKWCILVHFQWQRRLQWPGHVPRHPCHSYTSWYVIICSFDCGLRAVRQVVRCRNAVPWGRVHRSTRRPQDHHLWPPVWVGDEAGNKPELWQRSLRRSGMDNFAVVWREYSCKQINVMDKCVPFWQITVFNYRSLAH